MPGPFQLGDFVRYKMLSDEYQYIDDDGNIVTKKEKRQATDNTYSLDRFMIVKIAHWPNQTLYYLDQVDRPFVASQLLAVPMHHTYRELDLEQP